jgi:hypothetical protein
MEEIIKNAPAPVTCLIVIYLMVKAMLKFLSGQNEFLKTLHVEHLEARRESRNALKENADATRENTQALQSLKDVVRSSTDHRRTH